MTKSQSKSNTINRRQIMQVLGATATAGLAGCFGDDEGDDDDTNGELGERVNTIRMDYWSDYGAFTTMHENMSPTIQDNFQDILGVDFSIVPKEFNTQTAEVFHDERQQEISFWWHTNTPDRLDPNELLRRVMVDWAGNNGNGNQNNYASCEYSEYANAQRFAETAEEREELVYEAQRVMTEDAVQIQVCSNPIIGAYRTDALTIGGDGGGLARTNPNVMWESTSPRDEIVMGIDPVQTETRNFNTHTHGMSLFSWNHMFHSPLIQFNGDLDIVPVLAEDWEIVDASQANVTLRDDITFSNGDPITADDVRFTWEMLWAGGDAGVYPRVDIPDVDEIIVEDDQHVEFHFNSPTIRWEVTEMTRWGILHQDTFEAENALDDPAGFEWETGIGSGPFELGSFDLGDSIEGIARDDHPQSPDFSVIMQAYRSEETMVEAMLADEIQFIPEVSPGSAVRIDDSDDDAESHFAPGFVGHYLAMNHPMPPSKFPAFNQAASAAMDRQEMVDLAFRGQVEPELLNTTFNNAHPMQLPEEMATVPTNDPTGDEEAAQQILRDAGWGWDNNGNLHYPPDADLTPLWPGGEEPDPADFPCLDDL